MQIFKLKNQDNTASVFTRNVNFWFITALFCLLISIVSCSKKEEEETLETSAEVEPVSRDYDQIKEDGKLTVLMGNSSSSYFIYRGQPMGFEYELLALFAKDEGLELEVIIVDDLNEVFELLNKGEGDVVAANITVTKERAKKVAFSDYLITTRQVLVQRKPKGWENLSWNDVRKGLIRNQLDLIGKEVHVRQNSSYYSRLLSLSDEIGGDIDINTVGGNIETEELIKKVALGDIDFTIADEHIAQLNATYFSNLDVATPISFPQRLAWATRSNSTGLVAAINNWIKKNRKGSDFNHLVMKYYKNQKAYLQRSVSGFHSQYGGRVSIYDASFKKYATISGWDWRLIASLAYQESKFNNELESWAGARGLMQMMPATARRFGGDSIMSAEKSIQVGINYLNYLNDFWQKTIPDSAQRLPFVVASYNAGIGHVLDANRLSVKYQNEELNWDVSSFFLLNKSQRRFYSDKVVKHGYCRGSEPVKYVSEILNRYEQYKKLIPLALDSEDELIAKR